MKLAFKPNIVDSALALELDFESFFSLFDLDMPLLPHVTLDILSPEQGEAHFRRLAALQRKLAQSGPEIGQLIEQSQKVLPLDHVFSSQPPLFLEPFHLHSLGNFIDENIILLKLEANSDDRDAVKRLEDIKQILTARMTDRYSGLFITAEAAGLQNTIQEVERSLKKEILCYEEAILAETGIKMVYPFSREIPENSSQSIKARQCSLLTVQEGNDYATIGYRLPHAVETILAEKDRLDDELSVITNSVLTDLNSELGGHFEWLASYYQDRKKRTLDYILIQTLKKYDLCLPELKRDPVCRMQKAVLPVLKKQKEAAYHPLSVTLKNGSNVLYGANLTGKTTVLKTVFFHALMVQVGLPIPAESVEMTFPGQVALLLKSSGSVHSNLSGFGEELQFFSRDIKPGSYNLVDELFLSTDPDCGTELSRIFLDDFNARDGFFFCTSHYRDVLRFPDIALFRMKDIPIDEAGNTSPEDLARQFPFELEPIAYNEVGTIEKDRKPLQLALHFDLPDRIKNKIRRILKQG